MTSSSDSNTLMMYRMPSPKGRRRGDAAISKKKLSEMKIGLYLRKSSEEEEKQFNSTKDQDAKCRSYLAGIETSSGKTLTIKKVYEEHKSAATAGNRPEFNKLLDDIYRGEIDAILAYHPDRLARNMLEAGILLDMVRPAKGEEAGILQTMLFPTVAFSNDSGGRLMLAVLFSMATQYSDHLSEVVQRGVDSNLARGKSSGTPKWGYVRDNVSGFYVPDRNFNVIRKGWEMLLDGKNRNEVLEYWREQGVSYKTKERSNKASRKIFLRCRTTVDNLFHDPFYYGLLTQAGEEKDLRTIPDAKFKPMVSEDEYNRVQALIDGRSQNQRKSATRAKTELFIPFQGVILCHECGQKLYGYSTKTRKGDRIVYYGHQNKKMREKCERYKAKIKGVGHEVRGKVIMKAIYDVLDALTLTGKEYSLYKDYFSKNMDLVKDGLMQDKHSKLGAKSQYQHQLNEENETYRTLVKRKSAPESTLKKSEDVIVELGSRISELEKEISELDRKLGAIEKVALDEKEFLNLIKKAPQQMRDGNFPEKDAIFRKLFLNLSINKKNEVTFLCKSEFSNLFKCPNVQSGGDIWT